MDPSFKYADDDFRDLAFVCATSMIGSWDVVQEYLAYRMFPLSASRRLQTGRRQHRG
jgi:hypothetical protein